MTDKLVSNRKGLIDLLKTKGSSAELIQKTAGIIGVYKHNCKMDSSFIAKCIKCGKCVKTCRDIVGVDALRIINEGGKKEVLPAFSETAYTCIGCGSCVYICPVKCIEMEDKGDSRIIHNWKVNLKLKKCKVCNNNFAPEAQLDYFQELAGLPEGFFDTCTNCK